MQVTKSVNSEVKIFMFVNDVALLGELSRDGGFYGFPSIELAHSSYYSTAMVWENPVLVEVTPNTMDEIFVFDGALYSRMVGEITQKFGYGASFSQEEIVKTEHSVTSSRVPLANYSGQYKQPTYIVFRPIQSGEMKVIPPEQAGRPITDLGNQFPNYKLGSQQFVRH
jgi:hypothetical protein